MTAMKVVRGVDCSADFVVGGKAVEVAYHVGSQWDGGEVISGHNGLSVDGEEAASSCPVRNLANSYASKGARSH